MRTSTSNSMSRRYLCLEGGSVNSPSMRAGRVADPALAAAGVTSASPVEGLEADGVEFVPLQPTTASRTAPATQRCPLEANRLALRRRLGIVNRIKRITRYGELVDADTNTV